MKKNNPDSQPFECNELLTYFDSFSKLAAFFPEYKIKGVQIFQLKFLTQDLKCHHHPETDLEQCRPVFACSWHWALASVKAIANLYFQRDSMENRVSRSVPDIHYHVDEMASKQETTHPHHGYCKPKYTKYVYMINTASQTLHTWWRTDWQDANAKSTCSLVPDRLSGLESWRSWVWILLAPGFFRGWVIPVT